MKFIGYENEHVRAYSPTSCIIWFPREILLVFLVIALILLMFILTSSLFWVQIVQHAMEIIECWWSQHDFVGIAQVFQEHTIDIDTFFSPIQGFEHFL